MKIKNIGIVGSGQMGSGIAQVCAAHGSSVVMYDISLEALKKAMVMILESCHKFVQKNKMTNIEKDNLILNIKTSQDITDLKDCDMVIEAATENVDLKLKIFKNLDEIVKKNAYLCSNTSSISITKIAGITKRADLVCGLHFMNPVPLMKLVEGVKGLQTSEETFKVVRSFAESLGKTFVEANDYPGFIVNRILMPMINEAVYALYEGVGKVRDIDISMKLGTNQPMGPLSLADFIGLDTCLAIMNVLYEGLGDSKYRPCPLLVNYVQAGWLGKKTKKGFYSYE